MCDYSPVVDVCTHALSKAVSQDVCFKVTRSMPDICSIMQGSQSRSASLKQVEEEGLLKAGEAGSSTFLPLETDLTSQQRAAFRYSARDKAVHQGWSTESAHDVLSFVYICVSMFTAIACTHWC